MNQKSSQQPMSKRQALREQRSREARRQRLITIGAIVAVAVIFLVLLIIPQIQESNAPVGEFARITPETYPMENGLSLGDPNAPVKVEIFEDFKCSACQAFSQSIEPNIIASLVQTGQVYYIFHNYPFLDDNSVVKDSDIAASAAMCAAEQNRFYDYKKILYTNLNYVVGEFSNKRMVAFAESLGLDMQAFQSCFEDDKYKDEIRADVSLAGQMVVTGTPSVFVNGAAVAPGFVPTFDQINEAVQKALTANQ